jgi:hypothetical protein
VNRGRPGLALAVGVVAWVVLITMLHGAINGRGHAVRVAAARLCSLYRSACSWGGSRPSMRC